MFKTIVVGIDGSEPSDRALDTAVALAKAFDGEIHVVHAPEVVTVQYALGAVVIPDIPTMEQMKQAGDKVMSDAVARLTSAGVTPASNTIGNGTPCDEVIQIAELYSADLIITGRRGLGGISGLFLGSTSQKIAHDAKCACMTVK